MMRKLICAVACDKCGEVVQIDIESGSLRNAPVAVQVNAELKKLGWTTSPAKWDRCPACADAKPEVVIERYKPESSTNVQSVEYHPRVRLMTVTFRGEGDVYDYEGVPSDVWEALKSAKSAGKFLNETVKPNYGVTKRPRRG